MLGGLAIISLILQLLIVYSFVWGKSYQMKYKGSDGKEISINGNVGALRAEIKKELKEDIKEIIKEIQENKNKN